MHPASAGMHPRSMTRPNFRFPQSHALPSHPATPILLAGPSLTRRRSESPATTRPAGGFRRIHRPCGPMAAAPPPPHSRAVFHLTNFHKNSYVLVTPWHPATIATTIRVSSPKSPILDGGPATVFSSPPPNPKRQPAFSAQKSRSPHPSLAPPPTLSTCQRSRDPIPKFYLTPS